MSAFPCSAYLEDDEPRLIRSDLELEFFFHWYVWDALARRMEIRIAAPNGETAFHAKAGRILVPRI